MRTINYVLLKDLKQYYKDKIKTASDFHSLVAYLPAEAPAKVNVTEDSEIEIQTICNFDEVVGVKLVPFYNAGYRACTLVPSGLVKSKEVQEAIDLFKPVLDALHPGCWYWTGGNLYIRYPELTLKNTLGLTHTIYDLVVLLHVNQTTGQIGGTIYGNRFKLSNTELKHKYLHSHLKVGRYNFDNPFCLGSSYFATYLIGLNKSNTAAEFEMFLFQLKEYLQWESIEGGPHCSIRKFLEGGEASDGVRSIGSSTNWGNVTEFVIRKIKEDPSLVYKAGRYFIFDPGLNSAKGYELEKQILEAFSSLKARAVDYSESRNVYVGAGSNSVDNQRLPSDLVGGGTNVALQSVFGIKASIIEDPKLETTETLVKRLPTNAWTMIIEQVNRVLLQNLNKNVQRAKVSEESVSARTEQVTESSPLFA